MGLEFEPSSKPLHISAWLFLNRHGLADSRPSGEQPALITMKTFGAEIYEDRSVLITGKTFEVFPLHSLQGHLAHKHPPLGSP